MGRDFDPTNTGSLFENDRKESDRHPDLTGSAVIKCPHCGKTADFWMSVWEKVAASGRLWKSVAFKVKEDKGAGGGGQPPRRQDAHNEAKSNGYQPQRAATYDDDIPF